MPDAHPPEALVRALQSRGAELGDRQGLRVREGSLRRAVRGRFREGPSRVIELSEGSLELNDYTDEYREGLQKIIDAKIAGEEIVAPSVDAPPRVVNLMEALKKSLNTVSAQKKRPAKASLAKPAAKRKRA